MKYMTLLFIYTQERMNTWHVTPSALGLARKSDKFAVDKKENLRWMTIFSFQLQFNEVQTTKLLG